MLPYEAQLLAEIEELGYKSQFSLISGHVILDEINLMTVEDQKKYLKEYKQRHKLHIHSAKKATRKIDKLNKRLVRFRKQLKKIHNRDNAHLSRTKENN